MYVSTAGVGRRSQKNSGTPSRVQDGRLHTDNISVLALNIRSIITYCSHWHKIVIPKLCCGSCTCTWNDSVFFCCIHCTTRSVMYGYVVELCQPCIRRCRITATSSIRHPTAPGRTASPAQLLWPTGFLCGWSVGLEFPAGQLAGSDYWREQFQTISEDVSVRNVLMYSAH